MASAAVATFTTLLIEYLAKPRLEVLTRPPAQAAAVRRAVRPRWRVREGPGAVVAVLVSIVSFP